MTRTTRVKVCGVTRRDDAEMCVELGVDALGLNFWPESVRRCPMSEAQAIVRAVRERVRIVAVVVDPSPHTLTELRSRLGDIYIQLHGTEAPAFLDPYLPHAYKALRVGRDGLHDAQAVLDAADRYGGDEILLDTAVPGAVGGTGKTFDWTLAAPLAARRRIWLAGGLDPTNVAAAIEAVHPHGVDVASGVESAPGRKDRHRVEAFLGAVSLAR